MFNKSRMWYAYGAGALAGAVAWALSILLTGDMKTALLSAVVCTCVSAAACWRAGRRLQKGALPRRYGPAVLWFTGLSGAGKTTIARELRKQLQQIGIEPVLLDGDEIRNVLKNRGFDEQSRKAHNLQTGLFAALLEKQGQLVIVALISPYADVRDEIRAMCANFIEVHVSTDLQTCMQRDPKGLYKKALSGEIQDFTGISAPYEAPDQPELRIDTAGIEAADCARSILRFLENKQKP